MKAFLCILLYFLFMFALASQAKPPRRHHCTRAAHARQYRRICEQRANRKDWPRHAPRRY